MIFQQGDIFVDKLISFVLIVLICYQ